MNLPQPPNGHQPGANPEPGQRPWVTPSFERIALRDALSGAGKKSDGTTFYS